MNNIWHIDKKYSYVYTIYIRKGDKMVTTIQKWGNSQGIRIPKLLLDMVKWSENEQIAIKAENGKLVIEKAEDRKNIKELFEDYDGEYEEIDVDWGNPVGDEIW